MQDKVKDIEQIVAALGDICVATASSVYSGDLLRKVRKAKSPNIPSFIPIICLCPMKDSQ
jgi:pyruvate/2-oxoacid:ferredoxin oxidoreductase beta subunit